MAISELSFNEAKFVSGAEDGGQCNNYGSTAAACITCFAGALGTVDDGGSLPVGIDDACSECFSGIENAFNDIGSDSGYSLTDTGESSAYDVDNFNLGTCWGD